MKRAKADDSFLDTLRRNSVRKSNLDADKELFERAANIIERQRAALHAILGCYVERFDGEVIGLRAGVDLAQPYRTAKAALK